MQCHHWFRRTHLEFLDAFLNVAIPPGDNSCGVSFTFWFCVRFFKEKSRVLALFFTHKTWTFYNRNMRSSVRVSLTVIIGLLAICGFDFIGAVPVVNMFQLLKYLPRIGISGVIVEELRFSFTLLLFFRPPVTCTTTMSARLNHKLMTCRSWIRTQQKVSSNCTVMSFKGNSAFSKRHGGACWRWIFLAHSETSIFIFSVVTTMIEQTFDLWKKSKKILVQFSIKVLSEFVLVDSFPIAKPKIPFSRIRILKESTWQFSNFGNGQKSFQPSQHQQKYRKWSFYGRVRGTSIIGERHRP